MTRAAEPILHVDLDAFYAVGRGPEGSVARGQAGRRRGARRARRGRVGAPTRPGSTASVRRCRRSARGASVPTSSSCRRTSRRTARTRTGSARSCAPYTPLVEPISLDEAFLDVGGRHDAVRLPGRDRGEDPRRRRARGRASRARSASPPTKFVAKLASDALQAERDARRARRRRAARSWSRCRSDGSGGSGRRPARLLGRLGIRTIGDLGRTPRAHPRAAARRRRRPHHLHELAHGVDDREVIPYEAPKSVSHEETFERDLDADEDILRELLDLSGRVAARLREDGYRARTVVAEGPSGQLHRP